ncbi:MAG: DoxX family protein [Mycobacteriales bacterium]|nr:DoxX family membrane protein [Frankia sp.]
MLRRASQLCMSAIFVSGGIDVLRNPAPRVAKAEALGVPHPEEATKANATAMIVCGTALAADVLPRTSALVLAGCLVPTTLAGHPFWQETDKTVRAGQQAHFLKNVGLFGGLLAIATRGRRSEGDRRLVGRARTELVSE